MKKSRDAKERRKHKRKTMENIVVGIINHEDPETIGTIIDISQGGVKCAYNELRMTPDKSVSRSIDLIAGSQYVLEVPCKSIWQTAIEKQSHNKSTIVKHCGIQFDELTSNQNFLLGKFINRCACFEEDESGKR